MSDNWQAGERRPVTSSPVSFKYGMSLPNSVYNYYKQRADQQAAQAANRRANLLAQQRLRGMQQAEQQARLRAEQYAVYSPQQGNPVVYNGPGSAGNLYGQQGQAYGAARAAATAQAQAVGPTGTWTGTNYNGAGSAANLYAQQAQATYARQTGQQWYNLRQQQAKYKANINVAPSPDAYYFGPGSMEQFYATQAYANAPINVPTVPNTNYGGGSYGGGYGSGGGGSYVAAEPDIPRWLYGMLNWRYR